MSIFSPRPKTVEQRVEAARAKEQQALGVFHAAADKLEEAQAEHAAIAVEANERVLSLEAAAEAARELELNATRRSNRAGRNAVKVRGFFGEEL